MKNKVLLLSDDIRGTSGVSHISQKIVKETVDLYDWVQIAALRNHPENNYLVDVSKSIVEHTGVQDASVKLYPSDGYGDAIRLLNIIDIEKPDVILHISDPHNFKWLYDIDFQIRTNIPLMYYHVWDNDPIPYFNESVYKSCDYIACISKKTHKIVNEVCSNQIPCDYVPHGVSSQIFHKINNSKKIQEVKTKILNSVEYDFIIFSNNVNTPRKQLPNLLKAFNNFTKKCESSKICLLMHCNPGSTLSTNLKNIYHDLYSDSNIIFTDSTFSLQQLNELYNISDVVINNASNEGFGLATLESLLTETPIIATDTGGLSDQMYDNDKLGEWAYAIKPTTRVLNSSNLVPYIYDDICSSESIETGMSYWYNKTKDERDKCGLDGRKFAVANFSSTLMTNKFKEKIKFVIDNFKPVDANKIIKI